MRHRWKCFQCYNESEVFAFNIWIFNAPENVYIERTLYRKQEAENQFHFHKLSTFNDDTRLGSLRGAICSVYLFVCFKTLVINAPVMVPQRWFRLTKAGTIFGTKVKAEINFPPRFMKPTSIVVKFRIWVAEMPVPKRGHFAVTDMLCG